MKKTTYTQCEKSNVDKRIRKKFKHNVEKRV